MSIYVDFGRRTADGRIYVASQRGFGADPPELGSTFLGTDHEQFVDIPCRVVGWDRVRRVVYFCPVDPADVPGTPRDFGSPGTKPIEQNNIGAA